MATIQPNHNIELTNEQRQQLADIAQKTGKPWQELLSEFLAAYRKVEPITEDSESAYPTVGGGLVSPWLDPSPIVVLNLLLIAATPLAPPEAVTLQAQRLSDLRRLA